MRPRGEPLVFYDSEFTTLDPRKGELLSVGMIKENGEELYVEIARNEEEMSAWVKKNIVPKLEGSFLSPQEACKKIRAFFGEDQPFLLSFVAHYDMIYLHKLFGITDEQGKDMPYQWLPLDFASMLYSAGHDPRAYSYEGEEFERLFGVDPKKYHKHHALEDARLLREVYQKGVWRTTGSI